MKYGATLLKRLTSFTGDQNLRLQSFLLLFPQMSTNLFLAYVLHEWFIDFSNSVDFLKCQN